MRIADVFMAFPQIVLALLLLAAFGPTASCSTTSLSGSRTPRGWRG